MIVACIPAFNEEKNLPGVIEGLKGHVDKVIVCDDGSRDGTANVARRAGAMVIVHERNLGYGAAISTLFKEARREGADIMVTIDGDGQHDPRDIPKLVKAIEEGADVAAGVRDSSMIPDSRKLGHKVLDAILQTRVRDSQCGFRAYRASKAVGLVPGEMGMGAGAEILQKARADGLKIAEVPVAVSYEGDVHSQNAVRHGLDALLTGIKVSSMRHPLVLYGIPGLILFMISSGLWAWALAIYRAHGSVFTNTALLAILTTFSGMLLMAVAVILWVMISVVRSR